MLSRILFLLVISSSITSCQVLSVTVQYPKGQINAKELMARLKSLDAEDKVYSPMDNLSEIATEIQEGENGGTLVAGSGDCKGFVLPPRPNPPRMPDLEPWQLDDPDAINAVLVSHIENLQNYMEERRRTVNERYRKYLESCPEANIKTDAGS